MRADLHPWLPVGPPGKTPGHHFCAFPFLGRLNRIGKSRVCGAEFASILPRTERNRTVRHYDPPKPSYGENCVSISTVPRSVLRSSASLFAQTAQPGLRT